MSAVPDLMRIGAINTEMAQDVQTIITDPVVFDQNTCRITLQNIGFLHSLSRITFQVEAGALNASNASNANMTFPAGVGIHSLIERATLMIGGKTVCEVEDFGHFMGYKSMFIDGQINKQRESVLSGRIMAHEFQPTDVDESASSYGLDNGTFPYTTADLFGTTNGWLPVADGSASATLVNKLGILPNDNLLVRNEPELQVALADLFPFLRFNQLPLYMMNEQVSINLVFVPKGDNRRVVRQGVSGAVQEFNIKEGSVKLIADYLTFPGEIMAQYQEANKEMNFNYVDYRLTKRTYNGSGAVPQTKQILNVGGAGRVVNKIFCALANDNQGQDNILNAYTSIAPGTNGSGNVQVLTTNVRYNDEYLYPIDRVNPALEFHDIVQTEGFVPHITKAEYNTENCKNTGGGLTNIITYNGHSPFAQLNGKFFYQAHRLNKNERVNSRGIELETTYSELPDLGGALNYTQRVWIEVLRTATLRNGIFDCYYA
tara:strand:+ start:5841 stop:7301 length:1461 start_codon:yes stop_codon:yes gene_type:complete